MEKALPRGLNHSSDESEIDSLRVPLTKPKTLSD